MKRQEKSKHLIRKNGTAIFHLFLAITNKTGWDGELGERKSLNLKIYIYKYLSNLKTIVLRNLANLQSDFKTILQLNTFYIIRGNNHTRVRVTYYGTTFIYLSHTHTHTYTFKNILKASRIVLKHSKGK